MNDFFSIDWNGLWCKFFGAVCNSSMSLFKTVACLRNYCFSDLFRSFFRIDCTSDFMRNLLRTLGHLYLDDLRVGEFSLVSAVTPVLNDLL